MSSGIWTVELLGPLCVRRGEQIITRFRTQQTGTLLAFLACQLDRALRRDELVDMLWPDYDLSSGRNCLRIALNSLRQVFDQSAEDADGVVLSDRSFVRFNPAAVTTDKEQFESRLKTAMRAEDDERKTEMLVQAVSLYRSNLLPDFDESWVLGERQRLMDSYLVALRKLVKLKATHDFQGALDYAKRAVQTDPLREESHRVLMQLYVAAGRPASALRQYKELTELLREELETEPSAATKALVAQIGAESESKSVAVVAAPVTAQAYPSGSPSSPGGGGALTLPRPSNLPVPMTRFFGREECISQIQEMFRTPETRLVTLTGLGGCGKTRLALALAQQMQPSFDATLAFVPLADLPDASLLPDAILSALQLPRRPHLPAFEQVVSDLTHRPALLILDNFEHLVEEGAPLLANLLARAPQLLCLVTSRQRLNLAGEYEFSVAPLPTPHTPGTPARLLEFACVQLFVDRARAVRPGFDLDSSNAASVAKLCHHLEGVPLAIELAAAYVQALTPAQILSRLSPRLKLLVNRNRDASPRHASLRAALEWSYELLAPEVQSFLARLSVFRGGFTLEAAEALFTQEANVEAERQTSDTSPTPNAQRPTPMSLDALECLLQLRERSLVNGEEDPGGMRFSLLEIVREFAADKLSDRARVEAVGSHRTYYQEVAQAARPLLTGPKAGEQLDLLEREQDNFRAALGNAMHEPLALLRLSESLWLFWYIRGYAKEGSEWLERALEQCGSKVGYSLRSPALLGAGNLAYGRKDLESARHWYEAYLELARSEGNVVSEACALGSLGNVANDSEDYERAKELFECCLVIFEKLGDAYRTALARANLALASCGLRDYVTARRLHEQSLTFFRSIEDKTNIALALLNLSHTLVRSGDDSSARLLISESLVLAEELQDRGKLAQALTNCISLLVGGQEWSPCAVLCGSMEALRERSTNPFPERARKEYERERAQVQAALGGPAFSSALVQGQGMSLEQITLYALEALKKLEQGAAEPARRP